MELGDVIWFENGRVRVWGVGERVRAIRADAAPCVVATTHGPGRGGVQRLAPGSAASGGDGAEGAVVIELLDGAARPRRGPTEPTAGPAVRSAAYDTADFAAELAEVRGNTHIGDEIWYEDDDLRIWSIAMRPGGRVPFHCHTRTYFWVCTDAGAGRQHFPDGALHWFDFRRGDIDFLDITPAAPVVHDLENVGESDLRFLAVELFGERAAADA